MTSSCWAPFTTLCPEKSTGCQAGREVKSGTQRGGHGAPRKKTRGDESLQEAGVGSGAEWAPGAI